MLRFSLAFQTPAKICCSLFVFVKFSGFGNARMFKYVQQCKDLRDDGSVSPLLPG